MTHTAVYDLLTKCLIHAQNFGYNLFGRVAHGGLFLDHPSIELFCLRNRFIYSLPISVDLLNRQAGYETLILRKLEKILREEASKERKAKRSQA